MSATVGDLEVAVTNVAVALGSERDFEIVRSDLMLVTGEPTVLSALRKAIVQADIEEGLRNAR